MKDKVSFFKKAKVEPKKKLSRRL